MRAGARVTPIPCVECGFDLNDPFHNTPEGRKEHWRVWREKRERRGRLNDARRERLEAEMSASLAETAKWMAKEGEPACLAEWPECSGYEGEPHSCGVREGHKVKDFPHTCVSCFETTTRRRKVTLEDKPERRDPEDADE